MWWTLFRWLSDRVVATSALGLESCKWDGMEIVDVARGRCTPHTCLDSLLITCRRRCQIIIYCSTLRIVPLPAASADSSAAPYPLYSTCFRGFLHCRSCLGPTTRLLLICAFFAYLLALLLLSYLSASLHLCSGLPIAVPRIPFLVSNHNSSLFISHYFTLHPVNLISIAARLHLPPSDYFTSDDIDLLLLSCALIVLRLGKSFDCLSYILLCLSHLYW